MCYTTNSLDTRYYITPEVRIVGVGDVVDLGREAKSHIWREVPYKPVYCRGIVGSKDCDEKRARRYGRRQGV